MVTREQAEQIVFESFANEKHIAEWWREHPHGPPKPSLFRRLMRRVQPPPSPRFLARWIYRLQGTFDERIAECGPPPKLAIVHETTFETWYGWVFTVQTEDYLRTRDERHSLIGVGPVVVLKDTGEMVKLGTAQLGNELTNFEQSLIARQKTRDQT